MAKYVAPVRGGAICERCGALVPAYKRMPPGGGCRVRYHRCECGWAGKSVEKLEAEYWHFESGDSGQLTVDNKKG